jgi:hypothetical protein
MRALVARQRLTRAAVAAAAVLLVAACNQNAKDNGSGSLGNAPGFKVGAVLISDGTNVVQVGDQKITFPTTVTDAVFSPDGSRIAFVNGDNNIATAHPDGKGMKVLTNRASGVVRSHPAWQSTTIVFGERNGNTTALKQVAAAGGGTPYGDQGERDAFLGEDFGAETPEDGSPGSAPSGAPTGTGKELAFERAGSHGAEVWISDLNRRTPYQQKAADGSSPALSLDGTKVAYVDPSGDIEVLDLATDKAKPVKVSFGVSGPKSLTWTPDGKVAYAVAGGVEAIAGTMPAGATTNPPTRLSSSAGVPTFVPAVRDQVTRIAAADPVEVSIAASQASWKTVDVAYISQSVDHATALLLTGSANLPTVLAGAQLVDDGPILFTSGSTLDGRTAAEMKRVLGRVDSQSGFVPVVTILGGTDVVSAQAEQAVKALGYKTDRTTAPDPTTMAVTVNGSPSGATTILVVDAADVTGYAAAISTLGHYSQQSVLLTNGSTMPDKAKTFLNGVKPQNAAVYAVGSAAQSAMASSWSGKPGLPVTAVNSTADLLNRFSGGAQQAVVVDRSNLTDVITAIGLARTYGAPVFAIDPKAGLDDGIKAWLDTSSGQIDQVFIVDSKGTIGADLEHTVGGLVAGPLGATSNTNPKMAS